MASLCSSGPIPRPAERAFLSCIGQWQWHTFLPTSFYITGAMGQLSIFTDKWYHGITHVAKRHTLGNPGTDSDID